MHEQKRNIIETEEMETSKNKQVKQSTKNRRLNKLRRTTEVARGMVEREL